MYAGAFPYILVLAILTLLGVVVLAAMRPVLRRLALRNAVRRPGEAALVILGSMLGTAIIVGSFAVGDSFSESSKQNVYKYLGPIDEIVTVANPADITPVSEALASLSDDPRVDGMTELRAARGGVLATAGGGRKVDPDCSFLEADYVAAGGFGGPGSRSGLDGSSPGPGEVFISSVLADQLEISPGDEISIFPYGSERKVRVARVLGTEGIAGFLGIPSQWGISRGINVFVEEGALMRWWTEQRDQVARAAEAKRVAAGEAAAVAAQAQAAAARQARSRAGAQAQADAAAQAQAAAEAAAREAAVAALEQARFAPPAWIALVSNSGGVEGGDRYSDELKEEIDGRLAPLKDQKVGVESQAAKQAQLRIAKSTSDNLGETFLIVGSFSVIAGILLLVNIFVMLAEERKSELGMLRAIGMHRRQLVMSFVIEGAFYSIEAGLLGAALGVVVGRAIVTVATAIISKVSLASMSLSFHITPRSVAMGAMIGFLIGFVAIAITSLRIARINIIRAIREIPEPARKPRLRSILAALAIVLLGAAMAAQGIAERKPSPTWLGPSLVAFGLAIIAGRFVSKRLVQSIAAAFVVIWVIGADPFLHVFKNGGNSDFVLMGMLMAFAAAVLISQNQEVIARIPMKLRSRGRGKGLSVRIGLSYPLARRFRTGMTLVMFSLIIFTLVVIATFAEMQTSLVGRMVEVESGGYTLTASTSLANPMNDPEAELKRGPLGSQISGVAAATRTLAKITPPDPSKVREGFMTTGYGYPVWGVSRDWVDRTEFELRARDPEFASDADTWRAVAADPSLVIVDGRFMGSDGGPSPDVVDVGDELVVRNDKTGAESRFKIVGITRASFLLRGMFMGGPGFSDFFGEQPATQLLIRAVPGTDAGDLALSLNGEYLANGLQATSFSEMIEEQMSITHQFIRLMQGYLGLGLLIGIAGLAVVMIRAVRERRRQIGVLRALGTSGRVVRRSFLVEAGFVASEGLVSGTILGSITSYNIFNHTVGRQIEGVVFSLPVLEIGILLLVALTSALLFTAWPAQRASTIDPAVVLRIAD